MRHLSVVVILLAISVACSQQPAATGPPPTGTKPQGGRQRSCKSVGFHHETRVRAVVARSNSGDVIIGLA